MDHVSHEGTLEPTPAGARGTSARVVTALVIALAAFQARFIARLRRCGDAVVESPTGSGKTLLVRTLVALDLGRPRGFTHTIVVAPQEQIERGFLRDRDEAVTWPEGSAAQPTLMVPARLFRAAREDGCGTRKSIRRYLASAERSYALVCTHAALTALQPDDLPADLTGRLLVVDEAHHAPAAGLSRVAGLWRERGGRLLFLTATPYRGDGLPVVLPDMLHLRRPLAEHMEEGYAPRTLASEIMALGKRTQRVSAAQLTGEAAPPRVYTGSTVRAIVRKWEDDGRPKTIMRVPPGRGLLVRRLIAALERAGARVLDATGVERGRKQRFLRALDAERASGPAGSQVDVIVGIQRVLEGTDWATCSSVYCIGIPRSLNMIVQLAGRALRRKPADYRSDYRDLAKLVFFVPCSGGEAIRQLSLEHSRHVLLTCVFMADHAIGMSWIVTAAVQRGVRRGLVDAQAAALDVALDATTEPPDTLVRAEAQLALSAAREELMARGVAPTLGAVVDHVGTTRPDLPQPIVHQAAVEALATQPGGIAEQVSARLESIIARRVRFDPQVQEAMREAFARVTQEFRAATLARSPALETLGQQVHLLTGGAMREFAAKLAAAHPRPLTQDQILTWADEEHAATGRWPTAESGSVRGAPDETWRAIDGALRGGHRGLPAGGSLARLLEEHRGVANRLAPRTLTTEEILEYAARHLAEHKEWPTRDSGRVPGTPFTWSAIDQALIHGRHGLPGGSSLAKLLETLGARNIRNLPPLTDEQVATWARRFLDAHGRWPTRKDGQIDGAPEGETWGRVAAAIEQGLRSLSPRTSLAAFLAEVCGAPAAGTVRRPLTVEQILLDGRAYFTTHGSWPTAESKDPALEARGESWRKIDRALREGFRDLPRTTLVKLLAERLGVRNKNRPGPLSEATIWDWVLAHRRRTGKDPSRDSGPVHGAPGESWGGIDGALKHRARGLTRGETLKQFIARMDKKRRPR